MISILFRSAYSQEGPMLTELSLRSKSYWRYSKEYLEKCRFHLTIDEEYIRHWPVVVIEAQAAQMIGYYSLKVIEGENRLDNLWLDLPYIGKGFGKLALQHAIERAKDLGWDHFFLASEPMAVPFYAKFGGSYVGDVQSKLDVNLKLPHIKFTIK